MSQVGIHLLLREIKSDRPDLLAELHGQGQADVSQANNADYGHSGNEAFFI
jgi:hypothetical protein